MRPRIIKTRFRDVQEKKARGIRGGTTETESSGEDGLAIDLDIVIES